jgi:hypothetical protein
LWGYFAGRRSNDHPNLTRNQDRNGVDLWLTGVRKTGIKACILKQGRRSCPQTSPKKETNSEPRRPAFQKG